MCLFVVRQAIQLVKVVGKQRYSWNSFTGTLLKYEELLRTRTGQPLEKFSMKHNKKTQR